MLRDVYVAQHQLYVTTPGKSAVYSKRIGSSQLKCTARFDENDSNGFYEEVEEVFIEFSETFTKETNPMCTVLPIKIVLDGSGSVMVSLEQSDGTSGAVNRFFFHVDVDAKFRWFPRLRLLSRSPPWFTDL